MIKSEAFEPTGELAEVIISQMAPEDWVQIILPGTNQKFMVRGDGTIWLGAERATIAIDGSPIVGF